MPATVIEVFNRLCNKHVFKQRALAVMGRGLLRCANTQKNCISILHDI